MRIFLSPRFRNLKILSTKCRSVKSALRGPHLTCGSAKILYFRSAQLAPHRGASKFTYGPGAVIVSDSGNETKYNGHKNKGNNSRIRILRRIRSQQRYFYTRVYTADLGSFAQF
jgi:hypothetical protein